MRKLIIALAALATVAVALPATSSANAETVVIRRDGDHDRGLHRGWEQRRWEHRRFERDHDRRRVVIIKRRHHDRD